MKNNFLEIGVTLGLIILSVLFLNPFHFWMPDIMVLGMLALAIACFGILASFIIKEKSEDERENLHRALAGRNAFLVGAGILIIGILKQGLVHRVDPWLVGAFVAMLIVKFVTRIWSNNYR